MTNLTMTREDLAIAPSATLFSPIGRRLLGVLYESFVDWQSYRVLSEMRDDQLERIGGKREASGRVARLGQDVSESAT